MKLNKSSVEKLRQSVRKELENVPDGKRISLEMDELELLIFDYINIGGKQYKIPVWTGTFLRKLDLGYENLFDNVYWGEKYKPKGQIIDLSYTNAIIIFTDKEEPVVGCNFSGMDLSNSNIEIVKFLKNVDLSHANVPSIKEILKRGTYIGETKLCGIDLSDVEIQYEYYLYTDTNFSNTGIKLLCDKSELTIDKEVREIVAEGFKKGYYTNCYFNGKKILPLEEQRNLAKIRLLSYENFERIEINSFLNNVKNKIKRLD